MARVWMNHWFSTAYNIISLMRDAIPEIEMVGSNEHLYSPIMNEFTVVNWLILIFVVVIPFFPWLLFWLGY